MQAITDDIRSRAGTGWLFMLTVSGRQLLTGRWGYWFEVVDFSGMACNPRTAWRGNRLIKWKFFVPSRITNRLTGKLNHGLISAIMEFDTTIRTKDASGAELTFHCEAPEEDAEFDENYEETYETYTFRVKTKPEDTFFFQLTVRQMKNFCQVVMMDHYQRAEYKAKGIPEEIILVVAKRNNCVVASSSNKDSAGNFRVPSASKVWQRLQARGLAKYSESEDRYFTCLEEATSGNA